MYTIHANLDIKLLERQDVQQIGYSSNVIVIYLVSGDFIQIMGEFSLMSNNVLIERVELYPLDRDYGLLVLLDKKIIEVKTNRERNILSITFTGNNILTLIGSDKYESFFIKIGTEEVLV